MAYPSAYGDVELRFLKPALAKHSVEYTEAENHLLVQHKGACAVIDIEQGMCSGLSVEHACYRIGVDPIDIYNDIIRLEAKAERTK